MAEQAVVESFSPAQAVAFFIKGHSWNYSKINSSKVGIPIWF
jgi:hypothetical protein